MDRRFEAIGRKLDLFYSITQLVPEALQVGCVHVVDQAAQHTAHVGRRDVAECPRCRALVFHRFQGFHETGALVFVRLDLAQQVNMREAFLDVLFGPIGDSGDLKLRSTDLPYRRQMPGAEPL